MGEVVVRGKSEVPSTPCRRREVARCRSRGSGGRGQADPLLGRATVADRCDRQFRGDGPGCADCWSCGDKGEHPLLEWLRPHRRPPHCAEVAMKQTPVVLVQVRCTAILSCGYGPKSVFDVLA